MASAAQDQATKNEITLRGSTAIVTEFFAYSINSILYQRGIYPPEDFQRVEHYGLTMLVSKDEGLKKYLADVLAQLSAWLRTGDVQRLVLVVCGADSKAVLERWTFAIETTLPTAVQGVEKPLSDIQKEIRAIIRQITASVTFLPLIEEPCTFDLLVYTKVDLAVPKAWQESDPQYIIQSQEVRLRSFTTKIHKVEASVAYRFLDSGTL
eukprot:TRINITY_DN18746_c0_g1_i1.p1 TRINITY_DN18746_c0_g1~~TRINITY_DN18746_c0_g1_i1.p1  ORF type:complete len:216 (+),score=59.62 TRINITY_DN18746_c0_g1_i1:22-648(+)